MVVLLSSLKSVPREFLRLFYVQRNSAKALHGQMQRGDENKAIATALENFLTILMY
jgi:hypothetical protein